MNTAASQKAVAAVRRGSIDPRDVGEIEAVLTGGFDYMQLRDLISDLRNEPPWRRESDIDCDYFDHKQLDPDQLARLEEWGLPPAAANIIHPTISSVLGLQSQTRTDWQVDFEDDASEPVAKALGQKLSEVERDARADRALSEAYASQIKGGLGWIEVNRHANRFAKCKYRIQSVHRREIWWDWKAKDIGLTDGRYKVRRLWYDVDFLKALFPQMADIIGQAVAGWHGSMGAIDDILQEGAILSDRFGQAWDRERQLSLEDEEWRDQGRSRAVLFEIWYRVWKRGVIAQVGNRTVKLSLKNPAHIALIATGKVMPEIGIFPEMRMSFWVGPHRVVDKASPLPHDGDPYTPFWGFRADSNNAPFGLIRGMRWPQDEVNTRLSKMLSLLTSKRVMYEGTALDKSRMDEREFRRELSQHTAMLPVAEGAMRLNKIKIEENQGLTAQQFSVYQEMKQLVSEVVNVYAPLMGKPGAATAGVAINQLIEQGMTSLAEINDNFMWGQREVGEQAMEFVKADSTHEHEVTVGKGPTARPVMLNKRDPEGNIVENAVAYSGVKVSLSEVPQTPTYRQRIFTMIAEAIKSMPPQMQAVMAPMMIEMSNLPGRKEAARFLRQQIGLPDPDAPGGEDPAMLAAKQQYEPQIAELQAQLQQAMQELQALQQEAGNKQAEHAIKAADVKSRAINDGTNAQAATIEARARVAEAEAKRIEAEGNAAKAKAEGVAEIVRARAEAARPPETEPAEPAIDQNALLEALKKAVDVAIAPILKEVATMQGQMQAMGNRPEREPAQAPVQVSLGDGMGEAMKGAITEGLQEVGDSMGGKMEKAVAAATKAAQSAADAAESVAAAATREPEKPAPVRKKITLPKSLGGETIYIETVRDSQ